MAVPEFLGQSPTHCLPPHRLRAAGFGRARVPSFAFLTRWDDHFALWDSIAASAFSTKRSRSWTPSPPSRWRWPRWSTRTGLPRATAHRLAVALETHQLLARDHSGRFVIGPRLAVLAGEAGDALPDLAAPVLAWLRDEAGESAQLYRREGRDRVCIAVAERHDRSAHDRAGRRAPAAHSGLRCAGAHGLGIPGPHRRTDRSISVLRPAAGRSPQTGLGPVGGPARGRRGLGVGARARRPTAPSSPPSRSPGRSNGSAARRASGWRTVVVAAQPTVSTAAGCSPAADPRRGGWSPGTVPTVRAGGLPVRGDVGRLEVGVDALVTAFAAQAGLLETAERGGRIGHQTAVQPDHADLQTLADP